MRAKTWKALIVAALAVVILTAAVGGTMAWLSTNTQDLTNTFVPAKVTCAVDEPGWKNGNTIKENVRIKNTGTTDAYIRAMIVANWCTEDHKVVKTATPKYEGLAVGWLKIGDFYYYPSAVAPDGVTGELFTSCTADSDDKPEGDVHLEVNIICQAVQSTPATAVEEAWKVVTVGSDGKLTAKTGN